jgi:hypothetical protein
VGERVDRLIIIGLRSLLQVSRGEVQATFYERAKQSRDKYTSDKETTPVVYCKIVIIWLHDLFRKFIKISRRGEFLSRGSEVLPNTVPRPLTRRCGVKSDKVL